MEKNAKRLILLFSLILVVIPMVIFPRRLGMPLISGSAVYMLYEMVYYGIILYLFGRKVPLVTIVIGAAVCLVYRMALGAAFGLAIIVMYSMNSTIAFSLGMAKYLPAVLLHVLAAPFVIRSVYLNLAENMTSSKVVGRPRRQPAVRPRLAEREDTVPHPARMDEPAGFTPASSGVRHENALASGSPGDDGNQFERAVQYLGESASVKMALVVDEEGLPLARFNRCGDDVELWAPLSIVLEGRNRNLLHQYHRGGVPEKIDIVTKNMRIILRRIEHVTLMILAEQNADETILIRIAQAADMIRKYMSERYSPALFARVEERYVSNS